MEHETSNKQETANSDLGAVSRCFSRFNYWWNKHSGQYHWFEVRYIYTKNGSRILDWVSQDFRNCPVTVFLFN